MAPEPEREDLEQRLARLEQQDHQLERALAQLVRQDTARPRRDASYAAVIATLIGLLALAVSGYTAYVQRQQLRAQVWPYLTVGTADVAPYVGWHVINRGTGPARITAVRVMVHDQPVATWARAREVIGIGDVQVVKSQLSGTVVSAGQDHTIIRPYGDDQNARFVQLLFGDHAAAITICYCSVLDDCWVVRSNSARQSPPSSADPDACPIAAAERFKE